MRKIKEIVRLKLDCQLSVRQIARSCDVARSTVDDYLQRVEAARLDWPTVAGLTETELETRLFPPGSDKPPPTRPLPDFSWIQQELRHHKNVNLTLAQLWQEYMEQHPNGYLYSRFCELYREWQNKQDVCFRHDHRGGEKVFVDYCSGLFLTDLQTGEKIPTQLFVMVWGASNYTFAEASLSQDLSSWIGSHVRAFDYFGCVPRIVTGDNLKSGVTKACRYEPEINLTYAEMAEHYGVALIPTRPLKPRDKAKVEAGCLIAQRWILAVLRHRTFHSLAELNAAISELVEKLNDRLMRKLKKSRRAVFEEIDKPHVKLLPSKPYEFAEWRKATVNIDYHIAVDQHYYSVPFRYLHDSVDVRLSAQVVEIFRRGERITAHPRSFQNHRYSTLTEHMPPDHQKYVEWNPARITAWAAKTGPSTVRFVEALIKSKAVPEQAYRACLGIFRLAKSYPVSRVESACERALRYNATSFKSLRLILEKSLDQHKEDNATVSSALPVHENIRGEAYYN
jgi:transposase